MILEATFTKKLKTETLSLSFVLENTVLGILGKSGCGKSMTLRCLAGIQKPDTGRIVLNDTVLFDSDKKICLKPQKRNIGYLFQNYALFPNMTVWQNIAFACDNDKERVAELLERFYLQNVADLFPAVLSGGQQQRTAMARMLAAKPKVLLLDEPFSALDSFLRQEMEKQVQAVLSSYDGVAVLVSHNKGEIYRLTQKCMVMEQGKAAEYGDTKILFDCPKSKEGKLLIQEGYDD